MKGNLYIRTIYLLISSLISFVYLYIFLNLPNTFFRDRDVYLIYAEDSDQLFDLYSGIALYFNEPIFLSINVFLRNFLSSENIIFLYLCITISGTLFLLFKYSKNLFMFCLGLFLLAICHYSFHAQFVVLRQTIASIILLFTLTYTKDIKKTLIISFLCSFIHSSFFLITMLIFFYHLIQRFPSYVKSVIVTIASAVLGLFITVVGKYLGVRQATEDHIVSAVRVGGGAFLCFLMLLTYFLFFYKEDEKNKNIYDFSILGLSLFVGLYFVNPAAGRLMSTFILPIIFLLTSRFNILNIFIMVVLSFLFLYLDSQGAINEMSLNVNFDQIFGYIGKDIF